MEVQPIPHLEFGGLNSSIFKIWGLNPLYPLCRTATA